MIWYFKWWILHCERKKRFHFPGILTLTFFPAEWEVIFTENLLTIDVFVKRRKATYSSKTKYRGGVRKDEHFPLFYWGTHKRTFIGSAANLHIIFSSHFLPCMYWFCCCFLTIIFIMRWHSLSLVQQCKHCWLEHEWNSKIMLTQAKHIFDTFVYFWLDHKSKIFCKYLATR